jgi:hypothetical protein
MNTAGLLGAIKIAHLGTQNHKFDLTEIERLYQQNYGSDDYLVISYQVKDNLLAPKQLKHLASLKKDLLPGFLITAL